jgi:prevent-host-death family protein
MSAPESMVNLINLVEHISLVNMTKLIKLYDAKTHLSSLVDRAAKGEEFIIAKGNEPMARLVPLSKRGMRRAPGGWEGRIEIADDFDAPLSKVMLRAFEDPE